MILLPSSHSTPFPRAVGLPAVDFIVTYVIEVSCMPSLK